MNQASNNPTAPQDTGNEQSAPQDPYSDIVSLWRQAVTKQRLMNGALRTIARYFKSPYATLHIRYSSEVLQDDCHFGNTDPGFWKDSLQDFLTDSLTEPKTRARELKAKQGGTRIAFLSAPLYDPSGPAIGAIALVVAPIQHEQVTPFLARLESLARLASFSAEYLGVNRGGAGSGVSGASAQARARASQCETPAELAFAITNELRNKLGCEQVILGMVNRRRVKIISISGLDDIRKQSPGVVSVIGAMEECLDSEAAITYQQSGGWSGNDERKTFRMHKQWHACAKGDAVASVPLRLSEEGEIAAILSIRQQSDQPFTTEHVEEIRKRVEPFAAALRLTEQANRNLLCHVRDSVYSIFDHVTEPGKWGRKIVAATLLLALVWFSFGSMNYDLGIEAVVTAAEIRHVANPFDGILVDAPVVEGDRVQTGDVLCRLDQRDLLQQRAQLNAELKVLETNMDIARAADSPYEVQLANAKQQVVTTKLAIVHRRIEQATLRAPIDGVIIAGDLRKRIGGVLQRGDPLFQIAPLDRWSLELRVPDASSADIRPELTGMFASFARPDVTQHFQIERVLETAQPQNTKNVFLAEADLKSEDPWLRPGMEGVAKVRMGRRRVWWIALHKAIDYLRINFWL